MNFAASFSGDRPVIRRVLERLALGHPKSISPARHARAGERPASHPASSYMSDAALINPSADAAIAAVGNVHEVVVDADALRVVQGDAIERGDHRLGRSSRREHLGGGLR